MAQAIRRCSYCKSLYPARRSNRKTCSDECRVKLAVQKDQERRTSIVNDIAAERAGVAVIDVTTEKALVRSRRVLPAPAINREPRRRCEACGRRVRLVYSAVGAVWLRPHLHNGQLCEGSRNVIQYPNEKEVEYEC
jgi:predicted nucleic acid-binding Zn ribbon protein